MPAHNFGTARDLTFLTRLAQRELAALCEYWIALGGASKVPAFHDFDPLAVPRLLPNLQIYRHEADGGYRIGLTGGRVADFIGSNNTGKRLDEVLAPAHYASRAALFDCALETGLPVAYRSYLVIPEREHRFQKRLLLPFVDTGPSPDLLLTMALESNPIDGEPERRTPDGIFDVLVAKREELD